MIKLPNDQLLAMYRRADWKAFKAFFKRNHRVLFGYLLLRLRRRGAAEAALRATFARIHAEVLRYDPQSSATLWAFRLARDVAGRQPKQLVEPELTPEALAEVRVSVGELLASLLDREERESIERNFLAEATLPDSSATSVNPIVRLARRLRSGAA